MSQVLVTYFSASGTTQKLAENISKVVKADLYEIKPEVAYTAEDLNWHNSQSRSSVEMKDEMSRPAIIKQELDISKYDIVFVGFPIWWYVAPTIINTFLESYDFSGKTIVPFATSGGSGMGKTVDKLKVSVSKEALRKEGPVLSPQSSETKLSQWIDSFRLLTK